MSLPIKDGTGASTSLFTTLSGSDHIPHHIINGSVQVTASAASPVYVTGAVAINQPVSVTIDLTDQITAVVSSSDGNGVWMTSSLANPVHTKTIEGSVITASISGTPTVTLANNAVTASISGTSTITGTVGISGISTITGTVGISGTPTVSLSNNIVTASIANTVTVTSSVGSPVYVTGNLGFDGTSTVSIATSSTWIDGTEIFYNTASLTAEGTGSLINGSVNRKSLYIKNVLPVNLYITIGDGTIGYSDNIFRLSTNDVYIAEQRDAALPHKVLADSGSTYGYVRYTETF